MIEIRKANETDKSEVWEIIKEVISGGDTYIFYPNTSRKKMLEYWFAEDKKTYVAILSEPSAVADGLNSEIVGTFFIKANQPDLGSHICNAGYMVFAKAKGKGIGKKMAEFSLVEARELGYKAMQFNFVVKSNEIAVKLWLALGFEIIGEIPEAFQHKEKGLTNALIMYRKI
ncbi:MAG TPA: GNAT family N-acetyltransferase [Pyrinomonadaceae bacterium]|nr:GNAT family N-acetyltransferase [Pyrinomonadaceae bacterium]